LWAELCGLAVTGGSLLLLLGPMGIMGAALSSVLGYAAVLIALVGASRALTRCSPLVLLRPGRAEIDRIRLSGQRLWEQLFPKQAEPAVE
jgi:Na+-driven multidrug efflux pump